MVPNCNRIASNDVQSLASLSFLVLRDEHVRTASAGALDNGLHNFHVLNVFPVIV